MRKTTGTILATVAATIALAGCNSGGASNGQMSLSDMQTKLGCQHAKASTKLQSGEPKRDKCVKCGDLEIITFTSNAHQKSYDNEVQQAYDMFGGSSILVGDGWSVMGKTSDVKAAKGKVGGTINKS